MELLSRRSGTRTLATAAVAAVAVIGGVGTWGFTSAAASTARPAIAADPVIEGQLMVAHGDNFTTGAMVMQTELRTASGSVPLQVPTAVRGATGHARRNPSSRTRAHTLAGVLAVSNIAPVRQRLTPRPAVSRRVDHHADRGRADAPSRFAPPTVSIASVKASTFGRDNSVAGWYSETSGGQVTVTGSVFGWYTGVKSCDLAKQLAAGAAAAKRADAFASDFDHLVVYTPAQACDFGGIGWVGQNGVFLNGESAPGLMEHELGHNLGLWHAGQYAYRDREAGGRLPHGLRRRHRRDGQPIHEPRLQRGAQVRVGMDPRGGGAHRHRGQPDGSRSPPRRSPSWPARSS